MHRDLIKRLILDSIWEGITIAGVIVMGAMALYAAARFFS